MFYRFLTRIIASIVAFLCAAEIFTGIRLDDPLTACWAGLILAIASLVIRPFLLLITLPVNILTLGLFTLVINTWMVLLTDTFLPGLFIPGFWTALVVSVISWVFNLIISRIFPEKM